MKKKIFFWPTRCFTPSQIKKLYNGEVTAGEKVAIAAATRPKALGALQPGHPGGWQEELIFVWPAGDNPAYIGKGDDGVVDVGKRGAGNRGVGEDQATWLIFQVNVVNMVNMGHLPWTAGCDL